jgi:hypothetical protein
MHGRSPVSCIIDVREFRDSHHLGQCVRRPPRSRDIDLTHFEMLCPLEGIIFSKRFNTCDELWLSSEEVMTVRNTCLKFVSLPGIFGVAGLSVAHRSCGAAGLEQPPTPSKKIEIKNKTDFVDTTIVHVICDLPFSQYFFRGSRFLTDQGLLIFEASRSHSNTPDSVGFLWTGDWDDEGNTIWQQTTFTRDRHPFPRRDSNPQSLQASSRRPTTYTARPPGSAFGRKTPLKSAED